MKFYTTNDYLLLSNYLINKISRNVGSTKKLYTIVSTVNYEIDTEIKCFRQSKIGPSTNLIAGVDDDLMNLLENNYYGLATIVGSEELVLSNFIINGLSCNPLTNINDNGAYKYVEFDSHKNFYNYYADSALFPLTYYLLSFRIFRK